MWTAATVALVVVAALLWRGSDAAATESTTAPPADVPEGTPAGAVSPVWSTGGDPLPVAVVQAGRVVVGTAHGVRALDPATGEEAWHYTRANARLCDATAVDERVVAVFATAGRCDEVVALDAGTGVRRWTRNLLLRPDVTLTSSPGVVLATAPTGVVTFDPIADTLRWRAPAEEGCRIAGAGVGAAGVVLLERCADAPAQRLRALDRGSGDPLWTRDLPVPAGAAAPALAGVDRLVPVVVGDELQVLEGSTGTLLRTLPLPAGGPGVPAQTSEASGTTFVWARGSTYALASSDGTLRWSMPARGLPAVPVGKASTVTGAPPVLVPEDGAFVHRDPLTGTESGRSSAADVPAGGRATTVGPVIVHRLPDRVIGYR